MIKFKKANPLLNRLLNTSPVIQNHAVSNFRIYGQYDCYRFKVKFFKDDLTFFYDDEDDYLHISKNKYFNDAVANDLIFAYESEMLKHRATKDGLSVVYADLEHAQMTKATDDIILTMVQNETAHYSLGVDMLAKFLNLLPKAIQDIQPKPTKFKRLLKVLEVVSKQRKAFIL